jgi:DNA-binding MarR family transcriptional regulator
LEELDMEELERARYYTRLLRRSMNRIRALSSEGLKPYGITSPQYLALLWISEHQGLIQGDLVAELDSDPNTVSAILRQLDKKKWIERRRHPTDGRAIALFATKRGKELLGVIKPRMDQAISLIFALLPAGHEAAIADWLERLAQVRELP